MSSVFGSREYHSVLVIWLAIAKHHNRILFLTVLEAGKSRIKALADLVSHGSPFIES
jgi:hypothetical protein